MSQFMWEVGVFGGKVAVVVLFFGFLLMIVGSLLAEHKKIKKKKQLEIEDLGEKLNSYCLSTQSLNMSAKELKKQIKKKKKQKKAELKKALPSCVYVLDFEGDVEATGLKHLREEVSILLKAADPKKDEVVLRLNNRGGLVHTHGLCASQLKRLRDKGFRLTVCVDEVAGSGGYLMACVAHTVIAAPFAVLGSIGVLAQIPNFYRFLQKQNVDVEEHYAGEYKRTLTLFGQTTEEKRQKLKEQLKDIHEQFKSYVVSFRPHLDLARTANGDHWLGVKAKELGLVDRISTSDDYLLSLMDEGKKVYQFRLKEEDLSGLKKFLHKKVKHILAGLPLP